MSKTRRRLGGAATGLLVGLVALGGLSCAAKDHEPFEEPTAADRTAVLSVRDLPLREAGALQPQRETLQKVRYENGPCALRYEYAAEGLFVYSSIHDEATVASAEHTFEIMLGVPDGERSARDELFQWGDASSLCTVGPDGWAFVGRRGTRVVWAAWGGAAYESPDAEGLTAFLAETIERMASHQL